MVYAQFYPGCGGIRRENVKMPNFGRDNDISFNKGHERIMAFFNGKKFAGYSASGRRVYIDPTHGGPSAVLDCNFGAEWTPDEYRDGLIIVSNNLQARIAIKK